MTDTNTYSPIRTPVGMLSGRDAVYLDVVRHDCKADSLVFEGELNARLCSDYSGTHRWLGYRLTVTSPRHVEMWELDISPLRVKSSFDLVLMSETVEQLRLREFAHVVFSTYDFVYSIVCKDYTLSIISERD
jgi:hypothetical protein